MSTTQNDRLRALLEPLAAEAGVDLEEIRVTRAGRRRQLMVVVDADGGVQLDAVADLSRRIGDVLDGSDAMGGDPYVLEVGSPGVDRPLTEPRHWRRATGRLVRARLAAGGEVVGRVAGVDDDGATVVVSPVKGRGGPTERRLPFSEIAAARVEVEFGHRDRATEREAPAQDLPDQDLPEEGRPEHDADGVSAEGGGRVR